MRKLFRVSLILFQLSGCAAHKDPEPIVYERIPSQSIFVGMTMKQISERLGPPSAHVGRKQYVDGTIDVYRYETYKMNYVDDTAAKKEYFFYFWKGRLVRWDNPGEWQQEADWLSETLGR